MGFLRIYDGIPSGNGCYSLLFFKWPIEIVDLPFDSMVVFHGYVSLPEGMVVSKVIGVPPDIIHFILGIFHEINHPYIVWGYHNFRKLLYNGES